MTVFQATILGIVQGLTEFLPVSSSGHLILVPALFGWPQQSLAFDAVTNVATLTALLVALREDVLRIVLSFVRPAEKAMRALGLRILVATVPALAFGLLFKDLIETMFRSAFVVVGTLAVWGCLLFIADRYAQKNGTSDITHVSWKQALLIGCFQALALIPGTSRSGVTITTGLFSGLNRETAARFSFLLGIPAIAAGTAYALLDFVTGKAVFEMWPLLAGFLGAFFAGIFAIRFLLKLLKTASYRGFAIYRIAIALLTLLVLLK